MKPKAALNTASATDAEDQSPFDAVDDVWEDKRNMIAYQGRKIDSTLLSAFVLRLILARAAIESK